MKNFLLKIIILISLLFYSSALYAEKYIIDTKGVHAFIQFKIKHLGYSWIIGQFNEFEGFFYIDRENINHSKVEVDINSSSINTGHARRDKHLRDQDFLDVKEYPEIKFISKSVKQTSKKEAIVTGDLTLHGVTKSEDLKIILIGEGKDPWGGYRMGFEGSTIIKLKDYNIKRDLGPFSQEVEIFVSIEGIRQ